jgi:uncharacterized membrane protein YhiD involved in acid resistance
MLDINLMDFDPAVPSFMVMLITSLVAFFLSSVIAITYQYTTAGVHRNAHFVQALALISVVAAMILQAIGESVAIGLGIIGALSIIRFRTSLNDPRNITFMFASLGIGIACGVKGFGIAITGTLVFCLAAIVMRFSPLHGDQDMIGIAKIRMSVEAKVQLAIEQILRADCNAYEIVKCRITYVKVPPKEEVQHTAEITTQPAIPPPVIREKQLEYVYHIRLRELKSIAHIETRLLDIADVKEVKIDFQKEAPRL